MLSKKLQSQQKTILDELSNTEPKGEYAFWTLSDSQNFSQADLAQARILSSVEEIREYLYPALCAVREWCQFEDNLPLVGTDVETTGLEYWCKEVIGWGFAVPSRKGTITACEYYLENLEELKKQKVNLNDYFHYFFVHSHNENQQEIYQCLAEIICEFNPSIKWCLHNAKFDQHWFKSCLGVYLEDIEDSMVQAHLLGERSIAIDMLAPKYLSRFPLTLSKLTGKEKTALRNAKEEIFLSIPLQELADYCAEDCVEGLLLNILFTRKLRSEYTTYGCDEFVPHTLWDVYEKCDRLSINALCWAEETGVHINWDILTNVRTELEIELEALELEIAVHTDLTHEQSKNTCTSPKQLRELLFDKLKLPTQNLKKTQTGLISTDVEALKKLKEFHIVPKLIVQHREYAKLQGTYIIGLWKRQRNGKIHTTFNNCQTATGRYSSSNPNLQNIPNPYKSELGKTIRKLFIPRPDYVLVKADYSQFELRILAHFSQDPYLLDAYRKGLDIHSAVTCLLFGIPYHEFDPVNNKQHKLWRTLVKNINFGLIYGMTAQKLFVMAKAAGLKFTLKDCQDIMEKYWAKLPGVTAWMAKTKLKAIRDGYTETILGRRRYFEFIHPYLRSLKGTGMDLTLENWLVLEKKGVLKEHKDQESFRACGNAPIQGSNADAIRICLYECFKEWGNSDVYLLLTVHDEIVLECPEYMHQGVARRLKEIMEGVITLDVPVVVEPSVGLNWGEC